MDRLFRRGPDTGALADFLAGLEVSREDTAVASDEAGGLAAVLAAEAVIAVGDHGRLTFIPSRYEKFL